MSLIIKEMTDKEMTPTEAIIVLDRLNTDGRIDVDRDELRAAVVVAKRALRKLDLEINFVKKAKYWQMPGK